MNDKRQTIVTHSGGFHADDVFAVAAILLARGRENFVIVRTRDPEKIIRGDIVIDVGREYLPANFRFDHHQEGGAGVRPNSIPYAAFGLIWKHFSQELCSSRVVAETIDVKLVQPIDAMDNGVQLFELTAPPIFPYLLQDLVTAFRPTWKGEADLDQSFLSVVDVAVKVLEREIAHAESLVEGETMVRLTLERAQDKRVVVLDRPYPYERVLADSLETIFVVEPDISVKGYWSVKAVKTEPQSFDARLLFPISWAGKEGAALVQVSGVPDAVFCHNQRFIAVAKSKEGAIALARRALDS
jgi:uncharacterized UPF0160 family protein